MAMRKPQTLIDGNAIINGRHSLGVIAKIKLPEVAFSTTEQKAGGFTREVVNGLFEKLEGELAFKEFHEKAYELLAQSHLVSDGAEVIIKGSIYQDGKHLPIVAIWVGNSSVEDGELEAGEDIERTLKFKLTKATLTINGKQEYFLIVITGSVL